MPNIPNLITFVRLALVPLMAWLLLHQRYAAALTLFLVAALSDALDGYIARRFGLASALGAALDPIADKLSMFVTTVFLAWHGLLPLWLAIAIVTRDVVIVAGAVAYRVVVGPLDVAPTMLSKLNTVLEFGLLLLVMGAAAGWFPSGAWLLLLFVLVFITVVASGAQYVWVWSHKASAAQQQRLKT